MFPTKNKIVFSTTLAIFALIAVTGLMWTLSVSVSEEANAWHSQFATKKECVNFMKDVLHNTTAQAQTMCNKVIPH